MKKLIKFLIASAIALLPVVAKAAVVVGPISTVFYKDEGVTVSTSPNTIDFVGSGVTVTKNGVSSMTVTITGGGGGGGGTPGGSTNQIQYNDAGSFGGGPYWDSLQSLIGIGTNTPESPIHIKSNSSNLGMILHWNAFVPIADVDFVHFRYGAGTSDQAAFGYRAYSSGSGPIDIEGFYFKDSAGNRIMKISPPQSGGGSGVHISSYPAGIQVFKGLGTLNVYGSAQIGSGYSADGVTPPANGLRVQGNTILNSALTLGAFNCSGNTNSGKLTADSSGVVSCADDISGSGGSGTTISIEEGGSSVVASSSITFNAAQFNVTSSGGKGSIVIDTNTAGGIMALSTGTNSAGQLMRLDINGLVPNALIDGSSVTKYGANIPAAAIASGSLGSGVIASSVAVNAVVNASIVSMDGSKITGTGTIPNAAIDGSSVTKLGASIDVSGAEITGVLKAASFPALTGDATTSAGSLTITVVDDSHNHTVATSTFAVTGGTFTVVSSTIIINGATTYWQIPRPGSAKVLGYSSAGIISPVDDQTSAGGGDNFGSHVATRPIDMAGFPILNVSSIGVIGSGNSFIDVGTYTALGFAVNGTTHYFFQSSGTINGSNILTAIQIGATVQGWDADLDDLADGSLTGSKVGSGVPAANIASGSLGSNVIASSIAATTNIGGLSGLLADAQKIKISTGGTQVAISSSVNFIEGTNVTLGTSVDGNNRVNITINSTASGGGGGASTLETFSNSLAQRSSPTPSIGLDSSMNMSVTGSTAIIGVSISSDQATTQTFTNKTFDANATGNVMAWKDNLIWNNADFILFGTTNAYYTTTSTNIAYGKPQFSGSASTTTNQVCLRGYVGSDFDTTTNITAIFSDSQGGIDVSSRAYIAVISSFTIGTNVATNTFSNPIAMQIANVATGGLNRVSFTAPATMTNWNTYLAPDTHFIVCIERQGDSATLDTSSTTSYFDQFVMVYGRRQ